MDFYLARHGEAVADVIEPSRPLTRAGRESVARVARLALEKAVRIPVIYHSGILRARQTADIFAEHLAPGGGVQIMTGLGPEDDPALAAAELALAEHPVMLVGHLPHLKRLASLLTGDGAAAADFTPATLACYRRDDFRWKFSWILNP